MAVLGGNTNTELAVGDRVHVPRPDGSDAVGRLVEDYAPYLISGDQLGRDWAAPRRWAIAVDDGTVVFADDGDLTVVSEPEAPTDSPARGTKPATPSSSDSASDRSE